MKAKVQTANAQRPPPPKLEELDREHGTALLPGERVFHSAYLKQFTAIYSAPAKKNLKNSVDTLYPS